MMDSWQPDHQNVEKVIELLQRANIQNPTVEFRKMMSEYNKNPEYNCYICYIFCHVTNLVADTRILAGIIFKDNVRRYWENLPDEIRHYLMKQVVPKMLDKDIGRIAGNIITEIYGRAKVWPEVLEFISKILSESNNPDELKAAFSALDKICEDHPKSFIKDRKGEPLNIIIPQLIQFFNHPDLEIKYYALHCILPFIKFAPPSLSLNFNAFLTALFPIAESPGSEKVLRVVIQIFCELARGDFPALNPHLTNIIKFMILLTNSQDEDLALEASEFWASLGESTIKEPVYQQLPQIIPLLLNGTRLSDAQIAETPGLEEDIIPDKPEDVNPSLGQHKNAESYEDSSGSWNLRKSCGYSLERLSVVYKTSVLDILIPLCQKGIREGDWKDKEACILALGASSWELTDFYSKLVPDLINNLIDYSNNENPLIQCISLWALSRYSKWICMELDCVFLEKTIQCSLSHIRSNIKKVREQTFSALAVLFENAGVLIIPHIHVILSNFMQVYPYLQDRGLIVIHDSLGALASAVGEELVKYIDILMPPLIQKWNLWSDEDSRLVPLMDCISYISLALGNAFLPFAQPVFERCVRLIQSNLVLMALARDEPENNEDPDKSFLVSALELADYILCALKASSASLISNSNIISLLIEASHDNFYQSLRAVFLFVGDLARYCPIYLYPVLRNIFPQIMHHMRVGGGTHYSLTNNATWAASEIIFAFGNECKDYFDELVQRASRILNNQLLNLQILQNAALVLSGISTCSPQNLANSCESFIDNWIYISESLEESDQKKVAYLGIFNLLRLKPVPIQTGLDFIASTLIGWKNPQAESEVVSVLQAYKNIPELWQFMMKKTSYQNQVIIGETVH